MSRPDLAALLRDGLNRHALARPYGEDAMWCVCLTWSADRTCDRVEDERAYEAHVAEHLAAVLNAAVDAWLADEKTREAVAKAVADDFYVMQGGDPLWPEAPKANAGDHSIATAALAALTQREDTP
jgi:hypothetical protein